MSIYFFNAEVYPNFASFMFLPYEVTDKQVESFIRDGVPLPFTIFEIDDNTNNSNGLLSFLDDESLILIDFNGIKYDGLLLAALQMNILRIRNNKDANKLLYEVSNEIMWSQDIPNYDNPMLKMYRRLGTKYSQIDLYALGFEKTEKRNLRQVAISLKWYKIQDQPIDPTTDLTPEQYPVIREHNENNILITRKLYYRIKDLVLYRRDADRQYSLKGWDSLINRNKAGIADVMLRKFYSDISGLEYADFKDGRTHYKVIKLSNCISDRIDFNDLSLRTVLDYFKSKVISDTHGELSHTFEYGGLTLKLGTGGLHSDDEPFYMKDNSEYYLIDSDVTSYYPRLQDVEDICPKHLDPVAWKAVLQYVFNTRVKAKESGNKTIADTLKIVANAGFFGKMGNEYMWVYDREALCKVTLNGQFYLIMLIERLTDAGFEVISANTDGIVTKVARDRFEDYKRVCEEWEDYTSFNLEYTNYVKYVRMDVNNYSALEEGKDKPKEKGLFTRVPLYNKGYDKPIIAIALYNYFYKDIPVEDTIKGHKDIYDFCNAQKVDDVKFNSTLIIVKKAIKSVILLSKNNRFYISSASLQSDKLLIGYFYKEYKVVRYSKKKNKYGEEVHTKKKPIGVEKGEKVVIFNHYVHFDNIEDYQVDYDYYIDQTNKTINKILGNEKVQLQQLF